MSIQLTGNDYYLSQLTNTAKSSTSALSSKLDTLSADSSTDEELMSACKDFEEYLIEQVVKSTKEALLSNDEEEEGEYTSMFSDTINQTYAKMISENANLGIADMLYNSIKNNTGTTSTTETSGETKTSAAESVASSQEN